LVDGAKKIDALKALQQVVNNPQTVSTVNDGNTSI